MARSYEEIMDHVKAAFRENCDKLIFDVKDDDVIKDIKHTVQDVLSFVSASCVPDLVFKVVNDTTQRNVLHIHIYTKGEEEIGITPTKIPSHGMERK